MTTARATRVNHPRILRLEFKFCIIQSDPKTRMATSRHVNLSRSILVWIQVQSGEIKSFVKLTEPHPTLKGCLPAWPGYMPRLRLGCEYLPAHLLRRGVGRHAPLGISPLGGSLILRGRVYIPLGQSKKLSRSSRPGTVFPLVPRHAPPALPGGRDTHPEILCISLNALLYISIPCRLCHGGILSTI